MAANAAIAENRPQVQPTASEVLVAGGVKERSGLFTSDTERQLKAKGFGRSEQLRKLQEKAGRSSFKDNLAMRGRDTLDIRDNKANTEAETKFKDAFKGGKEQDHIDRAEAVITKATDYLKYAAIQTALDTNGNRFTPELKAEYGIDAADFVTKREEGLDFILDTPSFRAAFSELLDDVGDRNQQRVLVEKALALDPKLRSEVGKRTEAFRKLAEALPPVKVQTEAVKAAEDKRDVAKEQVEYSHAQIQSYLELVAGAGTFSTTELGKIKQDLTAGLQLGTAANIDSSLKYLSETVLSKLAATDPNLRIYLQAATQTNTVAVLERQLAQAKGELGTVDRLKNTVLPARILPASEVTRLQALLETARNNKAIALDTFNKLPVNVREGTSMKIAQLQEYFSNKKEDNSYLQPFAKELSGIMKSQQEVNEANREIAVNARTMSSADKAQLSIRKEAEAKLLQDMENMMADSIESIMNERADLLSNIEIDETNKEYADAFKRVKARMESYGKFDSKSRQYKRDRGIIMGDVRKVLANGEEGIPRLLLRDLINEQDLITDPDTGKPLADKDGNPLRDPSGELVNWQTIDLDTQLPDKLKAMLGEAKANYGDDFSQKLLTDYFGSRGFFDMAWKGPLGGEYARNNGLTESELNELGRLFSDKFNILSSSVKGDSEKQRVMHAKLQELGVSPSSKKGKLLLAILAGLMAVAAAPVVAMGAPIAAGLAMGAPAVGTILGAATSGAMNTEIN